MLNLDPAKLLVILVLGLVVVGPERLPAVARQLSSAWRTVTKYREQVQSEIKRAMPDLDLPRLPTNPSGMLSGFVSDLIRHPADSQAIGSSSEPAAALEPNAAAVPPGQLSVRRTASARASGVGLGSDALRLDSSADDPGMN